MSNITLPEEELTAVRLRFPVGAKVFYRPVMGLPEQEETVVRSGPWRLGHGSIVLKVNGRAGGVSVDHLTLIGEAAE